MKRPLLIIGVVLLGLLLLACVGMGVPLEFVTRLALGWIFFLWRVLPSVTIDLGPWLTLMVCGALLTGGLHYFLQWLYREVQRSREPQSDAVAAWPFRWTASLLALTVLMFVAGIAMVGATHQLAWLATTDEPIIDYSGMGAIRRVASSNNLKQIGLGVLLHYNAKETLPLGATVNDRGELLHGWQSRLLPYLEGYEVEELYERIDLGLPWNDPANESVFRQSIPLFLYPRRAETHDDDGYALSHYAGNEHVLATAEARTFEDFPGGTSHTILAGEAAGNYQPWGSTTNRRDPREGINRTPDGFGDGRGGANILFLDGSVQYLFDNIDPAVLEALSRGQERPDVDDFDF